MIAHLPGVLATAVEVQAFCERRGWRFCCIGGVAAQRWGQPRLTQDVDLTILTGFEGEERFVDSLLEAFVPRRPDAREFALLNRVVLARSRSGVDLDIALGALPFHERHGLRRGSLRDVAQAEIGRGCRIPYRRAQEVGSEAKQDNVMG